MSDLPDFIQPPSFSSFNVSKSVNSQDCHKNGANPASSSCVSIPNTQKSKPSSLPEFVRMHVAKDIDQLQAAKHPSELLSKLDQQQTLWLDLEINPKNDALIDGAFVVNDTYWHFNAKQFQQQAVFIYHLLDKATYLGGHHLIEFDLPRLVPLLITALSTTSEHKTLLNKLNDSNTLRCWQAKAWDTLILSCLLIPHQPSHSLAKLYKANVDYNNPIFDCLESRCVFELCCQSWQILPTNMQILLHKLLPQLQQLNKSSKHDNFAIDKDNIFDIEAIFSDLPAGNQHELITLIERCISLSHLSNNALENDKSILWQHLGIATFINWLRYFDKPQARRPVWLIKHPHHRQSFGQAEQAFWQLHAPDEHWINQQCQHFFGFDSLREGQMSIVKAVLMNKDIPLGILPTGGGKSLTFQLPALILSRYQRQLTVVISPLKALIEDQVVNLHSDLPDYESRIAYLTSGQSVETQKQVLDGIWQGDIDIIYLSPERLRTHSIRQLLKNRPPAFWVLDEAHTLSQWGTDFRPDFLRIADHMMACYSDTLREHFQQQLDQQESIKDVQQLNMLNGITDDNDVPLHKTNGADNVADFVPPTISLVTATASARVKDDLKSELVNKLTTLTSNKVLVQYGTPIEALKIWRDDITAHFKEVPKDDREAHIYQILRERKAWYENQYPQHPEKGVALVYLRSRKGCNQYADDFAQQGLAAAAYHSKLTDAQKKSVLEKFKNDEIDVVVCTNAFGMGIDKEGIHTIVHSGPPNNLESYIQEIGRAARKSYEVGHAYMLWSEKDIEALFHQERQSRIPNTNTLRDCWTAIRPTLKKSMQDQWFPSSALASILAPDEEIEQLNTQVRVALLALERYGLLTEKDQQPAWVSIKLSKLPPASQFTTIAKLYAQLQQLADDTLSTDTTDINTTDSAGSDNDEGLTRYHLPELAMALGYSVKTLLKLLRELVNQGHAQWQVVVRVRLKYTHRYLKGEFNRLNRIIVALEDCLNSSYGALSVTDELEMQGASQLNTKALDNWLTQQRHNVSCKRHILPMFRALGILKTRNHGSTQVFVSSSNKTKIWQIDEGFPDNWASWIGYAKQLVADLTPLFEEQLLPTLPDKKDGDGKDFNLDKLAKQLQRNPDTILTQLEQLQRLELIELSRMDDTQDAIFFIGKHRKAMSKYHETAYQYLQEHYQDRCARIHMLNFWLQADNSTQQALIEDYFAKPLSEVIDRYISPEVDVNKPYIKDYEKEILPDFFSSTQTQIVKETSRAAMVLAGPGSGKTTVVVHRVAYLLMIEEIKPEKILILAYNRLAVAELRARLHKLIGYHAINVTIQTFHGLARQITGLSEKDAPDAALDDITKRVQHLSQEKNSEKRRDNARYQWMIEEAITQLQERPQHFQYIMVDEFQDIDKYQYEMIGLLADLQVQDDDPSNVEESYIAIDADADNFEQRGYLMVVGDDDQNLYAFRGASIRYIQQFEDNYHISTQQKYYLLNNYRSANNIVSLANDFIALALPSDERLKQQEQQVKATEAHPNSPIRYAYYRQIQGVDMAAWIASDIKLRLALSKHNTKKETIAILAPKWSHFDAIQHYLEALDITSQRYNENEQVIPINSLIGQALFKYLSAERLALINDNVCEFLERWRVEQGLNSLDKAWDALMSRTQGMRDVTYEQVLQALESILYDDKTQVVLITYHSAKGMEFDHVYVIDEQSSKDSNSDRPIYVALTRAKQTLSLLLHHKNYHPTLARITPTHAELVDLPAVTIPAMLSFHRFMRLDELVLTPRTLVNDAGRAFIEQTFCRDSWTQNRDDITGLFNVLCYKQDQKSDGFYSSRGQQIAQFSKTFAQENSASGQANQQLSIAGFTTTLFYQQDISWYERAGYHGSETSHYLIVPYVRFSVRC